MARRYCALYTPAVADVLDEKGFRDQVLPHAIKPLRPGMKVAGPAHPVKGAATANDRIEYYQLLVEALNAISNGAVLVYECSHDESCAHWGELLSHAAKARGARGIVVDGGVRDVDRIAALGFPVFCKFCTPADIRGRFRCVEFGLPVRIGSVLIRPGDYVFGDDNGIVAIPQEIAEEVLIAAEDVARREDLVRADLRAGTDPWEAMLRHGRF